MAAELELSETYHRLHALRLEALSGEHYDPDEFDAAVIAFRRAWQHARENDDHNRRRVA